MYFFFEGQPSEIRYLIAKYKAIDRSDESIWKRWCTKKWLVVYKFRLKKILLKIVKSIKHNIKGEGTIRTLYNPLLIIVDPVLESLSNHCILGAFWQFQNCYYNPKYSPTHRVIYIFQKWTVFGLCFSI